jgi:hypothetical protein
VCVCGGVPMGLCVGVCVCVGVCRCVGVGACVGHKNADVPLIMKVPHYMFCLRKKYSPALSKSAIQYINSFKIKIDN